MKHKLYRHLEAKKYHVIYFIGKLILLQQSTIESVYLSDMPVNNSKKTEELQGKE